MKNIDLSEIFKSMKTNDISELIIKEGSKLYEIRRGGFKKNNLTQFQPHTLTHQALAPHTISNLLPQQNTPQGTMQTAIKPSTEKDAVKAVDHEAKKSDLYEVKSPLVGTFYSSPKPDSQAFVELGFKVKK